jgi:hypothetical protein
MSANILASVSSFQFSLSVLLLASFVFSRHNCLFQRHDWVYSGHHLIPIIAMPQDNGAWANHELSYTAAFHPEASSHAAAFHPEASIHTTT